MRSGALFAGLLLCLLLIGGCDERVDEQSDEGGQDQAQAANEPAIESALQVVPEVLPEARQVLPGREVNVPQAGEIVERLPTLPVPAPAPRAVNLGIVVVEQANLLSTRRGNVRLAGTQGVDEDAVCTLGDGRTPLCTVLARTAVRRLIGQRSVSCTLTLRADAGQDHQAPCTLGRTDLSRWVVAQGWAFAAQDADDTLRAAQAIARTENRGLWPLMSQN